MYRFQMHLRKRVRLRFERSIREDVLKMPVKECSECGTYLFAEESIKTGLCEECRNPDLHDELESATDLEEKMDILLREEEK